MNEEKYLIEYDGWIKRCVNAYIARGKNQSAELREDLYQEARMVFVEFMRKNGYPPRRARAIVPLTHESPAHPLRRGRKRARYRTPLPPGGKSAPAFFPCPT